MFSFSEAGRGEQWISKNGRFDGLELYGAER